MNKNILFVIGGIILLGVGVYFYEQGNTAPTQKMAEKITDTTPTTKTPPTDNVVIPATTTAATGTPANAKVVSTVAFTVEGSNYSFTPNALSVKRGQTVSLTFKNKEGFHDWRIDEFNTHTDKVRDGSEQTISFLADKVGSFQYYCSVGQHRASGMWGTLTVTE